MLSPACNIGRHAISRALLHEQKLNKRLHLIMNLSRLKLADLCFADFQTAESMHECNNQIGSDKGAVRSVTVRSDAIRLHALAGRPALPCLA